MEPCCGTCYYCDVESCTCFYLEHYPDVPVNLDDEPCGNFAPYASFERD